MVDLAQSDFEKQEINQDDIDRALECLFSRWHKERKKLAARRQVEHYLELKRLREQIGDVFDLDDRQSNRAL